MKNLIKSFNQINMQSLAEVGGKNASLGEMYQKLNPKGIRVPDGFALTATAYRNFLRENNLTSLLSRLMNELDTEGFTNLSSIGQQARAAILRHRFNAATQAAIKAAYRELMQKEGSEISLAVRSSATAEDLPTASFAGQQESYLNIKGTQQLLDACLHCYASLFTDRAIKYRVDQGFDHMQVALSVGVQQMVRSDMASSGVIFTLDPESGFRDVVIINSAYGLGELIVKGKVDPDEFVVYKPALANNKKSILSKKMGTKQETLVYQQSTDPQQVAAFNTTTQLVDTPFGKSNAFSLNDSEIETLARWSVQIEKHYALPMDIEWAKDGVSNKLFIVQARPETVHSNTEGLAFIQYQLLDEAPVLVSGCGLGNKITAGRAVVLNSPEEAHKLQQGDVLVTDIT
ncbi:MAG: PEP/pyruvate-binding domain-containing protein, partial [Bacteroidota bacterium]